MNRMFVLSACLPTLLLIACPPAEIAAPGAPTVLTVDTAPGSDDSATDDSATDDSATDDSTGDSTGDSGDSDPPDRLGALIDASLSGQVGVQISHLPASVQEDLRAELLAEDAQFWLDRAYVQAQVIDSMLYGRGWNDPARGSLPLPPDEVWEIALSGAPWWDEAAGAVVQDFSFHTVIVTTTDSPREADPFLGAVGGVLEEPVAVPLDPVAAYQEYFYIAPDAKLAPGVAPPPPVAPIGLTLTFERLAWDAGVAAQYNVGEIHPTPQLRVLPEGLESNYIEWRWIAPDDCAVQEQCVGGTGWRRLLRFDASVHNQGEEALHIGAVGEDYNPYTEHNIFVYSECHEHYHFGYYGDFRYGDDEGDKKAFCLISTSRRSNNAASALTTDYEGCGYQGIAAGWGDDYSAYLDCQWIDITDLDTSAGPVTAPLRFGFNPDRFICEGERVLDGDGQTVFTPSGYTTEDGQSVDRPECEFAEGWDADNVASLDLTVPAEGSAVTGACPIRMFGGGRNCGYARVAELECTPGAPVTLACAGGAAHLRACEGSTIRPGLDCTGREALAQQDLDGAAAIPLTCPAGRGEGEAGGRIAVLAAAADSEAAPGVVDCWLE